MVRRVLKPRRGRGRPLSHPSPRQSCAWCREGGRPGPGGLCPSCVADFVQLLSSPRWNIKVRLPFIGDHPFCVLCEAKGKLSPTEDVDHIHPWRTHPDLFFDEANLQPLCKRHHSQKTVREDGGFGKPVVRKK